jgi:flagellar M-ring protein FliF
MAIGENISGRWQKSTVWAKAALAVGIVTILLFAAAAVFWASRDTYQVLFADLDPQDAAVIVTEIEKMKLPYRLRDEGRTILVDGDAVYKTRLKIMGNGVLLRGTVGFEIFNNSDFGMTEFAQKINYQRALQGELARTIMGFEEVKSARVHLVLPESGLFKKGGTRPKASVTLVTNNGRLKPEQISGIQRLVAAAVPEIEPSAVTIVDQRGVALTKVRQTEPESAGVSERLEVKKEMEAYLVRKIAELLDRAFGPAQAIVSVDVTLNHDQERVTRENVTPAVKKDGDAFGVVVRRRQLVQGGQAYRETEGRHQSETSGPVSSRGGAGGSTVETEYQSGRTVEQVVSMPGAIRRISVGVLLPNDVGQAQIAKIRDLVAATVGLMPSRGDTIAVNSIDQFVKNRHETAVEEAIPAATVAAPIAVAKSDAANGNGNLFGVLLALMLTGILLLVLLLRRMARRAGAPASLSGAEREQTLGQIRQWIDASDTAPGGGRTS